MPAKAGGTAKQPSNQSSNQVKKRTFNDHVIGLNPPALFKYLGETVTIYRHPGQSFEINARRFSVKPSSATHDPLTVKDGKYTIKTDPNISHPHPYTIYDNKTGNMYFLEIRQTPKD